MPGGLLRIAVDDAALHTITEEQRVARPDDFGSLRFPIPFTTRRIYTEIYRPAGLGLERPALVADAPVCHRTEIALSSAFRAQMINARCAP